MLTSGTPEPSVASSCMMLSVPYGSIRAHCAISQPAHIRWLMGAAVECGTAAAPSPTLLSRQLSFPHRRVSFRKRGRHSGVALPTNRKCRNRKPQTGNVLRATKEYMRKVFGAKIRRTSKTPGSVTYPGVLHEERRWGRSERHSIKAGQAGGAMTVEDEIVDRVTWTTGEPWLFETERSSSRRHSIESLVAARRIGSRPPTAR